MAWAILPSFSFPLHPMSTLNDRDFSLRFLLTMQGQKWHLGLADPSHLDVTLGSPNWVIYCSLKEIQILGQFPKVYLLIHKVFVLQLCPWVPWGLGSHGPLLYLRWDLKCCPLCGLGISCLTGSISSDGDAQCSPPHPHLPTPGVLVLRTIMTYNLKLGRVSFPWANVECEETIGLSVQKGDLGGTLLWELSGNRAEAQHVGSWKSRWTGSCGSECLSFTLFSPVCFSFGLVITKASAFTRLEGLQHS